jgi:hypothetical protein
MDAYACVQSIMLAPAWVLAPCGSAGRGGAPLRPADWAMSRAGVATRALGGAAGFLAGGLENSAIDGARDDSAARGKSSSRLWSQSARCHKPRTASAARLRPSRGSRRQSPS